MQPIQLYIMCITVISGVQNVASVKQLADELSVNKATIFRKLDELDLRDSHTTNDGPRGALDVDAFACSAIADALGKTHDGPKTTEKTEVVTATQTDAVDALKTVVEVLREQLRTADERDRRASAEIAEKNRQIEELQAQLKDANDRLDAARGRSWLDRLFGRGLPAPRQTD